MTELRLDPRNARRHSDKNKRQIKQSLETVGAGRSILADADGIVRAGNGVFAEWGDKPVKIVETDGRELVVVQRTDLRGQDAIRAAALDNLVADSSAFDYDAAILAEIARDDEVIRAIANEDAKLRELLRKENGTGEKVDPGELIDKAAQLQEKWQVRRGDVWQVGKHRLMCGDSASKEDVARLMDGKRAQMVFTDPPYNVSYQDNESIESLKARNRRTDGLTVSNDSMTDAEFDNFLFLFLSELPLCEGGAFYLCAPPGRPETQFRNTLDRVSGLTLRQCIVWVKDVFVFGRQDYHWRHESILYGWKDGAPHYFVDDHTQDTVWEIERPRDSKEHPTMKPMPLPIKAISNSSKAGDVVFDGFAGSGTTLVACEQTGRIGYGMEISEKYCSVTLERLANLGLQPQRLSDG